MHKLKLDLDALAVESFAADGEAHRSAGGTVHAHNHTQGHLTCGAQYTCNGLYSCDCPVTVDATCMEPCGTALCESVPPQCAEG